MKVMLRADTEKDNPEELISLIKHIFTNNTPIGQTQLTNNKNKDTNDTTVKKYFCNNPECKKEIAKAVVAYCLHDENKARFNGKVYCIKCQENHQ